MPATIELLAEKLRELETLVSEAKTTGVSDDEVARLVTERDTVAKSLSTATSNLHEGKRLLKG